VYVFVVRSDRAGLHFFFQHVLNIDWDWREIVRAKRVKSLPDVVSYTHIAALLNNTGEQRYQTFLLITYSMGLRLGE